MLPKSFLPIPIENSPFCLSVRLPFSFASRLHPQSHAPPVSSIGRPRAFHALCGHVVGQSKFGPPFTHRTGKQRGQNHSRWVIKSTRYASVTRSSTSQDQTEVLTFSEIEEVLNGVIAAVKIPAQINGQVNSVLRCNSFTNSQSPNLIACDQVGGFTFDQWSAYIRSGFEKQKDLQHVANLALCVAFLRHKSRHGQTISQSELDTVWSMIHTSLSCPLLQSNIPPPSRSAQGFLAVPLCSLIQDGNIDVLFRLHVWLPDGQRGAPGFAIHSHQPFATSWVLTGTGGDIAYQVDPVDSKQDATHAQYALTWTGKGDNGPSDKYKTHQVYSKIVNTQRWARAVPVRKELHTRNMSYRIPAAAYHRTEVGPNTVHATLFMFDSSGGFVKDAGVLGPVDLDSSTQVRGAGALGAFDLADLVSSARDFEDYTGHLLNLIDEKRLSQSIDVLPSVVSTYRKIANVVDGAQYKEELVKFLRSLASLVTTNAAKTTCHVHSLEDTASKMGVDLNVSSIRKLQAHVKTLEITDSTSAPWTIAADKTLNQKGRASEIQVHYRELFEQTVAPMLKLREHCTIQDIRRAYTAAREGNSTRSQAFDSLKYVRYSDLLTFGRVPRSSDGLTQEVEGEISPYIIFFSYRWINRNPWHTYPQTEENLLFRRIVHAVEAFLDRHPEVSRKDLGIWIDFACIDQDNPVPGVSALPMIVAQCNALISLIDCNYHKRAWCSLEAMMVLALRKCCNIHIWYEHRENPSAALSISGDGNGIWDLQRGPEDLDIKLAEKRLSTESDRSQVLFLEQLSKLLNQDGGR